MTEHPVPNLKRRREERGLRQLDLARKIGTTQNQISKYETAASEPNASVLKAMAAALETSIDYLCDRTNDPQPIASVKVELNQLSIDVAKLFNALNDKQQNEFYEGIIEIFKQIKFDEAVNPDD